MRHEYIKTEQPKENKEHHLTMLGLVIFASVACVAVNGWATGLVSQECMQCICLVRSALWNNANVCRANRKKQHILYQFGTDSFNSFYTLNTLFITDQRQKEFIIKVRYTKSKMQLISLYMCL